MIKLKQVIHYQNTNSLEATWVDENDEIIRCHSYADIQMQMFRNDVAELGGNILEYESMIAEVELNIQPIVPQTQSIEDQIQNLKPTDTCIMAAICGDELAKSQIQSAYQQIEMLKAQL
ncbi:MAG TPA: hypothetical protein VFM18_21750 [Methanosarcina sp.]|nr:hypothetical protein [Methanosarcina sp.]